jgi:predicted secreted protein
MSDDARGRLMVATINCAVNHNARAGSAARYPGMNDRLVDVLRKHAAGIIQMPCPERVVIDLPRTRGEGVTIREAMETPERLELCRKLAVAAADEIEEFGANGYTVAAILGGDVKSPGCAVPADTTAEEDRAAGHEWGVFTGMLREELAGRGIEIPIRGIRDSAEETLRADLEWLDARLAGARAG